MDPRLKFSLVISFAVLGIVSCMFLIVGAAEGVLCAGPVTFVIVFPATYLISSFFPKTRESDQPHDSSGSSANATALKEDARSDQLRFGGLLIADSRLWWLGLIVGGFSFLIFAFAIWVWYSEFPIIQLVLAVALLVGGIVLRSVEIRNR